MLSFFSPHQRGVVLRALAIGWGARISLGARGCTSRLTNAGSTARHDCVMLYVRTCAVRWDDCKLMFHL